MSRFTVGCLALAFLGLASLQAQTVYPPAMTAGDYSPGCCGPRPAATWPYGYYQTMWGQGVPYGYYQTSWTQGVCPATMPLDGFAPPMAGTPVPPSVQPLPSGEPLGAPRPLPSKP